MTAMIKLRSNAEIEKIHKACKIVAIVLENLKGFVRPGCITKDLEKIAEGLIEKEGARSAFKGYRGYPSSICASVNETVVHGIPAQRRLL